MKFICLLRQNGKRKEKGGGGGVTYAFYIFMILMVVLFSHFTIHRAMLQVFYHEFSDLVYSLEGKLLTYTRSQDFQYPDENNPSVIKNGTQFWDGHPYAMTYKCSVIVTETADNTLTYTERVQLEALAKKAREDLIREAHLDSSMKPQSGSLKAMIDTKGTKGKILIRTFRIYQPVYEHIIQTSTPTLNDAEKEALINFLINKDFVNASKLMKDKAVAIQDVMTRKIIGWNLYEVAFDEQNVPLADSYKKTKLEYDSDTNTLVDYPNISGSTVELELGTDVKLLGTVFSQDVEGESILAEYRQDNQFVSLLQRQDIVFATEDKRKAVP